MSLGGETAFPRGGYKVAPKKGNALMYYVSGHIVDMLIDSANTVLPLVDMQRISSNVFIHYLL